VQSVSFCSDLWVITKAGGVSIPCENAVADRIMVVPLAYPACSAARNDIVMEFKVFSCVLCCPDTGILSAIEQSISHSIMMARSTFCIPKNNRVLTVVKNAMFKDEPVAIGDSGHT